MNSMELTHNNWFKYGFNQVPFSKRQSATDQWFVDYGSITREQMSFGEECLATAKLIRDTKNGPLWVFLSGGLDSEIALRAFVKANIPVRAAIIRFKHDFNIHDISYAVIAAETLGVPYRFIELDIVKFLEETVFDMAKLTNSSLVSTNVVCWAFNKIDGIPVMGNGDCQLELIRSGQYALCDKEYFMSFYYYLLDQNLDGVPGFFRFTPETMLSWLEDETVKQAVQRRPERVLETLKNQMYLKYFDAYDRTKYTGYEKIRLITDDVNKILHNMYGSDKFYIEYNTLRNSLRGNNG